MQNRGNEVIYSVYSLDGTLMHRHNRTDGKKTDTVRLGSELVARVTNGVPAHVHADHLGSPVVETRADGSVDEASREVPAKRPGKENRPAERMA